MDIYKKLDEVGEYIEQAKVVPLINQKLLDTEYLMKCFEELYASIPDEIKTAKQVLAEQKIKEEQVKKHADELMSKTKSECEKLLKDAKAEAEKILNENNLTTMVEEEAKRIKKQVLDETEGLREESINQARELQHKALSEAQRIKEEAEDYASQILHHLDQNLAELRSLVQEGKRSLDSIKEQDLFKDTAKQAA